LESLQAEANNAIKLREFVPIEKIDPVYFGESYWSSQRLTEDSHDENCSNLLISLDGLA